MLPIQRSVIPLAIASALAFTGLTNATAGPVVTPLVSVDWLDQHVGDDGLRVIDLRSGDGGVAAFTAGHVPGAVRVDYPGAWRATRNGVPGMLPDIADLQSYVSSLGIDADTSVVLIPTGAGSGDFGGATWVYFVLKYIGHDAVAILDGGAPAWSEASLPAETGPGMAPAPAHFVADVRPDILATKDDVVASLGTTTALVDARSPAEYTGASQSRVVTRPGHIPGAINIDNATFYDKGANRLRPADQLAGLIPPVVRNAASVITYCNTGHQGSLDWFVIREVLGHANVKLYDGSMAEWSRTDLPIETGPAG